MHLFEWGVTIALIPWLLFNEVFLVQASVRRKHLKRNSSQKEGFDLYISRKEMTRTLGISAEMSYVDGGVVNNYSTQFPYRIAANITHLLFTWNASATAEQRLKYSLRAVAEDFDVLPLIHIPTEGYIPTDPETFSVEFRCAGARAGQFHVSLHFNVSYAASSGSLPYTAFTLRQEKICPAMDGRRRMNGAGHPLTQNGANNGGEGQSAWQRFFGTIRQRSLIYVGAAVFAATVLLCLVLLICLSIVSSQRKVACASPASAFGGGAGANAHSFYTAAAMLRASGIAGGGLGIGIVGGAAGGNEAGKLGAGNGGSSSHGAATKDTTVFDDSASITHPLLGEMDNANDVRHPHQPLTSTPCSTNNPTRLKLPIFERLPNADRGPKIIFERRSNVVDIKHSLIELNADRNLFVVMPHVEMEGEFGQIRWANWRQTGIGTSGDIDDEEDDANEDTALICKTLKPNASRSQFEAFLHDALMLHNVPAHPHLAQVLAAATFGNFNNPESIHDFPLISYRHSGFGILKKFLLTCRGINSVLDAAAADNKAAPAADGEGAGAPMTRSVNSGGGSATLRTHDLVSIATQILKAIQHLHTFGIIHKDVATRNCLVSELPLKLTSSTDRLYVQLGDNALSRDIFRDEYYQPPAPPAAPDPAADVAGTSADAAAAAAAQLSAAVVAEQQRRRQPRPVRWMAPEAIRSNVYNSASDVWTFGIFMWELFTCGQMPYADVAPQDMELAIASGSRPIQPYNCPDEIYGIMFSCWNHDPLERPSTAQLLRVIGDFTHQLRKYI